LLPWAEVGARGLIRAEKTPAILLSENRFVLKKLILINPVGRRSGYLMSRISRFAPLGLAYVAAVTPNHWQVKICDENFDAVDYETADLVGITAFTSNINRAYAIASEYRRRETPVVIGGIHASMFPDEAERYADSVVVGEAEGVWPNVIRDFEADQLAARYQGPRIDLTSRPPRPRRDLFHPGYFWHSIQTSRGCPFNCRFCSVSRYLGTQYRQRSPEDILDELAEIPGRYVAFVDDNLIGYSRKDRERAMALFSGMIDRRLRKRWWMQTSINAAEDPRLVKMAAKAGCQFVFIGFETLQGDALRQMGKSVNLTVGVQNYRNVVRTFHRHGIGVLGAFIIGHDGETSKYYQDLARFMVRSGIDMFQVSILTPLPGTALMEDFQREGRMLFSDFPGDWDRYRFSYVVHRPDRISAETIYTGDNLIKHRLYRFPTQALRLVRSAIALRDPFRIAAVYKLNRALKKSWMHSHYRRNYPARF
jgi:radical SAM superfamily enzyme YgiQ (UPF0313 family)